MEAHFTANSICDLQSIFGGVPKTTPVHPEYIELSKKVPSRAPWWGKGPV